MCDNNNNGKSMIAKEAITACHPCNNDPVACQVSNIRHVIANNMSVLTCYKNMKCAVLAYINAVSTEFVQNVDHTSEQLERARFNVLIESLIAALHQSVRSYTNGQLEPYFQLWIQDGSSTTPLWDIGAGSISPYNTEAYCSDPSITNEDDCNNGSADTPNGQALCYERASNAASYEVSSINSNLSTNCVDGCDQNRGSKSECEKVKGTLYGNNFTAFDFAQNGAENLIITKDGASTNITVSVNVNIDTVDTAASFLNSKLASKGILVQAIAGELAMTSNTQGSTSRIQIDGTNSGGDAKALFGTAVDSGTPQAGTWTNRYISSEWNTIGGFGHCSNSLYTTRDECLSNQDIFGNTLTWSQYSAGNLAKLFPNKIALFSNCNKDNGVRGDEILYHYNPSVQLLYNPTDSSLYLKWSDATYNENTTATQKCLFPLLSNEDNYMSEVLTLVPPSTLPDTESLGDDIWEDQRYVYSFIRKNCLLDNKDLHRLINQLETLIRKCELTHQSLKLKLKMSAADLVIDAFDPTA